MVIQLLHYGHSTITLWSLTITLWSLTITLWSLTITLWSSGFVPKDHQDSNQEYKSTRKPCKPTRFYRETNNIISPIS